MPPPRLTTRHPLVTFLAVATCLAASGCSDEGDTGAKPDAATLPDDDVSVAVDTSGTTAQDTAAIVDAGGGQVDVEAKVDTGCVKDCKGKICGPNGCGGVCGFCVTGQFCADDGTKCDEHCKPNCKFANGDPKKCGDDGCGGACGSCPANFNCGVDFLCHAKDCKPECAAKKCGDDGCGGLCGTCAKGDLCQPDGTCKPGPCKGIPDEGTCDGEVLVTCVGEGASAQKSLQDCAANGPKIICGWDAPTSKYGCIDKPPCTPNCKNADGTKKQCGSDGCDGQCGVCPKGWSCPGSTCQPEDGGDCGFLPAQGQCDGNVWIFCNTGKIKKIDCGKYNQKCLYDSGKFTCK